MIETLFENRITSETPLKKMEFLFELYKVPCFPRGELVAVAGKAKSGKTSFLSMLMGTGVKPGNEPPEGKGALPLRRASEAPLSILWYDTEQSQQSTQEILTERITKMAGDGHVDDHVYAFNVRTFGWDERLRLFQEAIPYVEPDLVVLDGVRDLIADINDGREAQLITEQLMTLAQQHWCCIVCVLHQNKSDSDHNLRGWIGTELTNKVFEVYSCEKLKDNTLKVEQERTRKYDIGRELYYRLDPRTQLPVTTERSVCDQPRDAKGRWVSQKPCADLRKLFAIAMEGRMQRPKRELMAVAMKKCGLADAKTYYECFDAAERQGLIRQTAHPNSGEDWVVFADTPLLL